MEAWVIRLARENRGWGYDRIVGALANLSFQVSDQTVGNILRRHNIAPAPERSRTTTWKEFIRSHMDVLAGADFFTVEVLTWRGLVTYYVLFFIEVTNRRVSLGGITRHPDSCWMEQVARNATMQDTGYLNGCRYLLHDRDKKFCREFREALAVRGGAVHTDTREKSEPERPRGALGTFDQRGMSDEADPVRGTLIATRRVEFPGTLSSGKKPPRQKQAVALPRPGNKFARCNPLPRAPRRLTEILQPGRMNFLVPIPRV